MKRTVTTTTSVVLGLGSLTACQSDGADPVVAAAAVEYTNPVADWNAKALEVLADAEENILVQSRMLSLVQVAIYEAVNSIQGSRQPYGARISTAPGASVEAAVATAAQAALLQLYPAQRAKIDSVYAASLAAVPDGDGETEGIRIGATAARAILSSRQSDGADAVGTYKPKSAPGAWQPTPPDLTPSFLPAFRDVTPWTLRTADQFRSRAPYRLDSRQYAKDYNEVKALGAAKGSRRTAEQTEIANFWYEQSLIGWNRIARLVSTEKQSDTATTARLFALLNMAGMDSYVACWEIKYSQEFWRPVTAIRAGADDGNPATSPDRTWASLLVTPANPDHVSCHSMWGGAAGAILGDFYGDDVPFSFESTTAPGVVRDFTSFSEASHENVLSRIYAGVHFRHANVTGEKLGTEIGNHALAHFLLK